MPAKKAKAADSSPSAKRIDKILQANLAPARPKRDAAKRSETKTLSILQTTTRKGGYTGGAGRAVDPDPMHPTSSPQPTSKSYKSGTYRIHWKGTRDDQTGLTSGNRPFIGTRDKKSWSTEHENRRKEMSKQLKAKDPGLENPFGKHFAENSHLHAGSLFGPNDVLSAPPASIHQNTEWLAIEGGIKHLEANNPDRVRIKSTGYVHERGEMKGTLKAARYKIYFDGTKVFDHVTKGARGNIDKDEYRALKNRVKALDANSPEFSLHGTTPNGIHGNAPSLQDARKGQRSGHSVTHPQFTDLQRGSGAKEQTLTGVPAHLYATGKLST